MDSSTSHSRKSGAVTEAERHMTRSTRCVTGVGDRFVLCFFCWREGFGGCSDPENLFFSDGAISSIGLKLLKYPQHFNGLHEFTAPWQW